MNKAEMIKELSRRLDCRPVKARQIISIWQDIISDYLSKDETIMLQGFGSFSCWQQSERPGRNPRTGKDCTIPPRTSVKFKPGKVLLKKLNNTSQ